MLAALIVYTFDIIGPFRSADDPKTWSDVRAEMLFRHVETGEEILRPAIFVGDGQGDYVGNKWRVWFAAPKSGLWTRETLIWTGQDIAIEGQTEEPDRQGDYHYGHLDKRHFLVGTGYPRLTVDRHRAMYVLENGRPWIKTGSNSPENLLNEDRHFWTYDPQDPTRKVDVLIEEELDLLARMGCNSVWMILCTAFGDGNDVYPWPTPDYRKVFDIVKIERYRQIAERVQTLAMSPHIVRMETENDQLMTRKERLLYDRYVVAVFGYLPWLQVTICEEDTLGSNGQPQAERGEVFAYYRHFLPLVPLSTHTFPRGAAAVVPEKMDMDTIYTPLLDDKTVNAASLQVSDHSAGPWQVWEWRQKSIMAGNGWAVSLDEIGPGGTGIVADSVDYWHTETRRHHLWGVLLAGGGLEYYRGYSNEICNDLDCKTWGDIGHLWQMTRQARSVAEMLRWQDMEWSPQILASGNGYARSGAGQVLAYTWKTFQGGGTNLHINMPAGEHVLYYIDPFSEAKPEIVRTYVSKVPFTLETGQAPGSYWDACWLVLDRPTASRLSLLGKIDMPQAWIGDDGILDAVDAISN